ncbi:MAG: hypothetical protein HFG49_15225 [Lachnospiraceae bacterium]|nr:hypothetical protein [Lachnospiraceae bacterium]
MNMDKEIKKIVDKLERKYIMVFAISLIFVFFSHGVFLSHKLSVHDDLVHMFDHGGLYSSGRWMQVFIGKGIGYIFGDNISLPLWEAVKNLVSMKFRTS